MNLEEIIRDECVPQGDCMLTVQDINGEAGFLYFKDGELIEANYAALWGKDAMAQILTWELAEHTVAPLPLGIKRSLWDAMEVLLNPGIQPTSSGRLPVINTRTISKRAAPESTAYDHFKTVPGVTKIVTLENGRHKSIWEDEEMPAETTDWLEDFLQKAKVVGETLGLGRLDKWTISTDRYHIVTFKQEGVFIGVLRRHEVGMDDFEASCQYASQRE
ncbi:MAG: hypothetical protein ACAI35_15540 [Candidatus Methylacidiphilales bacterium]|nr:hypothetical protein [Candidatus Methylacidiphilales bacterium]